MARAFIVLGPEDSGNRMMTNLLVTAGCEGKAGYKIPFDQPFDYEIPAPEKDIVWLRSVPHCGSYPAIANMIRDVMDKGYEPQVIIMVRAAWVVRKAQIKAHDPRDEDESQWAIENAYLWIFSELQKAHDYGYGVGFYMVPYSELVHEPRALAALCALLELPVPEFEFRNGNEKWYEDCRGDPPM